MKQLVIADMIAICFLSISAFAQVKPKPIANNHTITPRTPPSNPEALKTRETTPILIANIIPRPVTSGNQVWGNASVSSLAERPRVANTTPAKTGATPVKTYSAPTTISAPTTSTSPTQTYRVEVGDILDIHISTRSTLHTVMEDGVLDYPLAGALVPVGGLTTDVSRTEIR